MLLQKVLAKLGQMQNTEHSVHQPLLLYLISTNGTKHYKNTMSCVTHCPYELCDIMHAHITKQMKEREHASATRRLALVQPLPCHDFMWLTTWHLMLMVTEKMISSVRKD